MIESPSKIVLRSHRGKSNVHAQRTKTGKLKRLIEIVREMGCANGRTNLSRLHYNHPLLDLRVEFCFESGQQGLYTTRQTDYHHQR